MRRWDHLLCIKLPLRKKPGEAGSPSRHLAAARRKPVGLPPLELIHLPVLNSSRLLLDVFLLSFGFRHPRPPLLLPCQCWARPALGSRLCPCPQPPPCPGRDGTEEVEVEVSGGSWGLRGSSLGEAQPQAGGRRAEPSRAPSSEPPSAVL